MDWNHHGRRADIFEDFEDTFLIRSTKEDAKSLQIVHARS